MRDSGYDDAGGDDAVTALAKRTLAGVVEPPEIELITVEPGDEPEQWDDEGDWEPTI
ncbi:hypothetical protein D3C83_63740 [compost metagenome]